MNNRNSLKHIFNTCNEDQSNCYQIRAKDVSFPLPISNPTESIIPVVKRYSYIVPDDIDLTNGANLLAKLFSDDSGNPILAFNLFNPNGYVNVYINGVKQMGRIYRVTETSLLIHPYNGTIFAGTPILMESLRFT